ncbi:tetratricopeptide repeat protein [Colwellia ponticola]|nr:hypothetical protein [Colwellia ponticola]
MTIKKHCLFMLFISKVLFFSLLFMGSALAQPPSDQAVSSNQVQQLLSANNEVIDTEIVISLSAKIIKNKQYYSNDMLAKIYLLLARVASNQGNINNVFEYVQQGISANSVDKKVHLALLLKLAEVYMARKEYELLLEVAQVAVSKSELTHSLKYQLLSLSYRSVAFSMLGQHQQAFADLQKVEQGISQSKLTEHTELLTILALAYHHLSDYQTSLTMELKILKLKFEMDQTVNIDKTYLYLGYAYFYLLRFDDAYNAFWQARKVSENNNAVINIAHANKGLALVLIIQQQFEQALEPLAQAIDTFNQYNMFTDRIESMTALVKVKLGVNKTAEGYALLTQVVELLDGKEMSVDYTGFYRMVAEMHFAQKDYLAAYRWREKYSQVLLSKLTYKRKYASTLQGLTHLSVKSPIKETPEETSSKAAKKLAIKLAQSSALSSSFVEKYQKQHVIIITLSTVLCLLLTLLVAFYLRFKTQQSNQTYQDIEKKRYAIDSPLQTKYYYQLAFKKARKFKYPISIGYLVIDNWQALVFHFNKKNINEVTKEVASIINEHITDFDYAGLFHEGEYLLVFEHESRKKVNEKLVKIIQALNTRAFANLGGFSLTMKYSLNTPDYTDIDPLLFLARVTDRSNVK